MISNSTLILIFAIVSMNTGLIGIVISLYIVTSSFYDSLSISGTKPDRLFIMSFVFMAGGIILLISLGIKQNDAAYSRYVREAAPDSGYSVYYNGQAVSGSALGVDRQNFDDFDIKYDEKNKIIKIMKKR